MDGWRGQPAGEPGANHGSPRAAAKGGFGYREKKEGRWPAEPAAPAATTTAFSKRGAWTQPVGERSGGITTSVGQSEYTDRLRAGDGET